MKKLLSLVLAVSMLLALTSCGGGAEKKENLYNRGLDLIQDCHTLSKSESYISSMFSGAVGKDQINLISSGNFTLPENVYVIEGASDILLKNLIAETNIEDEVKEILKSRLGAVIPSQLNAFGGVSSLAVSNMFTADKAFLNSEISAPVIYLYDFGTSPDFMVSFTPNSEGIVTSVATVILNDEVNSLENEEELKNFLVDRLYLDGISVNLLEK